MLKETPEGIVIPLKIIPKASRNEVLGWENDELKVRIAAVPEKGDANSELIRFLAKILKISKSSITLISGDTSRHKRIRVSGVSLDQLLSSLPHSPDQST